MIVLFVLLGTHTSCYC